MRRLLLACTCALLAGCAAVPVAVDPPRPGAPPEEVVAVLIEAVNARDAEVLPTVATAGEARTIERTWFGTHVDEVQIDPARPVEARPGQGESVHVHVDVTLGNSDGSLPEGELVGWGYTLVRQDDGRWLVTEQGVG